MASKNERNFSEEQIRQHRDAVIGLQAGTNIGANQVGSKLSKLVIFSITPNTGWNGRDGK